jgi:hypothetical protein
MSDTAKSKGYIRGREYLRRCNIQTLTFSEYRNLGRVDVKQQYKQQKAMDAYLLGWWHAGEQFASLFKPDDSDAFTVEKRIKIMMLQLDDISTDLEELLHWRKDDTIMHQCFKDAFELLNFVQANLEMARDHLAHPEETQ